MEDVASKVSGTKGPIPTMKEVGSSSEDSGEVVSMVLEKRDVKEVPDNIGGPESALKSVVSKVPKERKGLQGTSKKDASKVTKLKNGLERVKNVFRKVPEKVSPEEEAASDVSKVSEKMKDPKEDVRGPDGNMKTVATEVKGLEETMNKVAITVSGGNEGFKETMKEVTNEDSERKKDTKGVKPAHVSQGRKTVPTKEYSLEAAFGTPRRSCRVVEPTMTNSGSMEEAFPPTKMSQLP